VTDPAIGRAGTAATAMACCCALAATPARLLRPHRPDRELLAGIRDAGVPHARSAVRLVALTQAWMNAPTAVVAEGVLRPVRMRVGMTTFLVEHPRARFLVDPAMCRDVHHAVLPQLPAPLRMVVTPKRPVIGLAEILNREGLEAADIDFAVTTHLHWDHVSGLLELPESMPVRTLEVERDWALRGPEAPLGVARGPLLSRTFAPYELDGPPILTFERSHDLFGDGSVILVDLAGHTPGSVGVLLAVDDGTRVLLAGDAVWNGLQVTRLRTTAPFPGRLTDANRQDTLAAIHRLHSLPSGIDIIASHDYDAAATRRSFRFGTR
jgi:glyoxylase-like metal-dependent hydrolase (beta-lactamase superfamily II)